MTQDEKTAGDGDLSSDQDGINRNNPLLVTLAPDPEVLRLAREQIGQSRLSLRDLSRCISADPVTVIELLKTANSVKMNPGKTQITHVEKALVALGLDTIRETFSQLEERPRGETGAVHQWIEIQRDRCIRTAVIAQIFSNKIASNLADSAYTAGLMLYVGEMVCVAHLKSRYVEIAEEFVRRSKILYRLNREFDLDVEKVGMKYLMQNGIPMQLLGALDREATGQDTDTTRIKAFCYAASEMIDAFDEDRWERIAPGKKIPSTSFIRRLQLRDEQYEALYEEISGYLSGDSTPKFGDDDNPLEKDSTLEKQYDEDPELYQTSEETGPAISPPPPVADEDELRTESAPAESETFEEIAEEPGSEIESEEAVPTTATSRNKAEARFGETLAWLEAQTGKNPFKETKEDPKPEEAAPQETEEKAFFGGENEEGIEDKTRDLPEILMPSLPPSLASRVTEIVEIVDDIAEIVESSDEFLMEILNTLVTSGFFDRAALLVISEDRMSASVSTACGRDILDRSIIEIDALISPLARSMAGIQSISQKNNDVSPFGSKSYAFARLEAPHPTPVILYADCGKDGAITLAGRRLFRKVITKLNTALPELPGGIPAEEA